MAYTSWKYFLLAEHWLRRVPRESAILQRSFRFQGEEGRRSFLARGPGIGCNLKGEARRRRHHVEDRFEVGKHCWSTTISSRVTRFMEKGNQDREICREGGAIA
jgi:hypothetical protein